MGTATVIGSLAALSSLIYLWLRGRMTSWGKKIVNISQSVVLWINQTLGSIKVNKVLGREAFFEKRCADLAFEHGRYNALALTFGQIPRLAIEVIGVAVLAALIAYHAAIGASAADILPTVGVFAVAAMRLIPAFNRIVGGAIGIRHERAALDHIHGDLISFHELDQMDSGHEPPLAFRTELRFDRVRYIYPDRSVSALADVSFSIRQGETVGIVGATGSGKTTLADILLGILPPTEGRLLVEGIDIASRPAAWRRNLGYVPQDIYLIDDSLRNNIALGIAESDIDPVRLAAVVKLARLESLIKSLPQGLDTRVGERGANLSGGQRQRVGIARALYGDPQVLVFDEATSALDNESERQIIETIEGLKGEKTVIIIAHRLSTVRHCDKLMFMKEGRVADTGPFDDLHRRNADFRRLVELGELRPESAPLPTAVS
jgi:ATP-binding cassette subfamily C protein